MGEGSRGLLEVPAPHSPWYLSRAFLPQTEQLSTLLSLDRGPLGWHGNCSTVLECWRVGPVTPGDAWASVLWLQVDGVSDDPTDFSR